MTGDGAPGNVRLDETRRDAGRASARHPGCPEAVLLWAPASIIRRSGRRIPSPSMDTRTVTNAAVAAFMAETGYVTLAERPPDLTVPGALVFCMTDRPIDIRAPPGSAETTQTENGEHARRSIHAPTHAAGLVRVPAIITTRRTQCRRWRLAKQCSILDGEPSQVEEPEGGGDAGHRRVCRPGPTQGLPRQIHPPK